MAGRAEGRFAAQLDRSKRRLPRPVARTFRTRACIGLMQRALARCIGAGTGFCDDAAAREFFTPGRRYRARGFVATSYFKYKAQDFMKRVRSRPPARPCIGSGRQRAGPRRMRICARVRVRAPNGGPSDVDFAWAQVKFADPVNACVLWRIELDYALGCNHVNLVTATHVEVRRRLTWRLHVLGSLAPARCIERRRNAARGTDARCIDARHILSIHCVQDEAEFLFSAYSAFEVVRVHWSPTPQNKALPHEITLRAFPDNRAVSEDVPLSPWS